MLKGEIILALNICLQQEKIFNGKTSCLAIITHDGYVKLVLCTANIWYMSFKF